MDERELPSPNPDLMPPAGDVDDLIFHSDPDWHISER